MFGKKLKLFKLFGFTVHVDWSWLIIAFLVTWSLAEGLFPRDYPDLAATTYWLMGVTGALGLFASIVFHELSHSLVARRHGVDMRGITLFIFGGVAEMNDEPNSPRAEFLVAIAGPIASVLVLVGFGALALVGTRLGWPVTVTGVLSFVAAVNGVLVAFNLVPAFPLDGGRVLRAVLWKIKGSLRWATRVAAMSGAAFGFLLIFAAVLFLFQGYWIDAMWFFLLGLFLRAAAHGSYHQLLIRQVLSDEPIGRFVQSEVRTVPPSVTVQELVEDFVYKHHYKMFPVVEDGRLVGCVTTRQIKDLPRDEWTGHTARELAEPCSNENTIRPDADAMEALTRMHRKGLSRLMVVQDGQLRGIISLKDMMRLISLKLDLEEEEPASAL